MCRLEKSLGMSFQYNLLGGHLHMQRKGFLWLVPDKKEAAAIRLDARSTIAG